MKAAVFGDTVVKEDGLGGQADPWSSEALSFAQPMWRGCDSRKATLFPPDTTVRIAEHPTPIYHCSTGQQVWLIED